MEEILKFHAFDGKINQFHLKVKFPRKTHKIMCISKIDRDQTRALKKNY